MKKTIDYKKYYIYHEELKYRLQTRITMFVIGLAIAAVAMAVAIATGEFIGTGIIIGMALTVAGFALFADLGDPLDAKNQIGYHGSGRSTMKRD